MRVNKNNPKFKKCYTCGDDNPEDEFVLDSAFELQQKKLEFFIDFLNLAHCIENPNTCRICFQEAEEKYATSHDYTVCANCSNLHHNENGKNFKCTIHDHIFDAKDIRFETCEKAEMR